MRVNEIDPEDDVFVQTLDDVDQVCECFLPDLDLEVVDPSDM